MLQSGDFLGWQGDISGMGQQKATDVDASVKAQRQRVENRRAKDPSYDETPMDLNKR